ncbi:hypothetical protein F4821DRAFT_279303 [Hypoxylon rubiginosum]|uniref:Uncharacterized protein n=1 Tax=Hypoxylon rubiginosum TaxID=110542 RepID=A0ACC0CYI4_9PEZI|nr:hypothetical protein F4821DRAFT_279303 [Hypoxylon rubiginosum]
MVSSYIEPFMGRLYCPDHGRLTCSVCLHSINSVNGFIPTPDSSSVFTCAESAHSVEPTFERFKPTYAFFGFHDGLSPDERKKYKTDNKNPQIAFKEVETPIHDCRECGLMYWKQGGPGYADIHPSHVAGDGNRYIVAFVEPFKFERRLDKVVCTANFWSSVENTKLARVYEVFSRPDDGTADWNLDNVQISALVQLLHMVEQVIIPHRKKLIEDFVYANSEYFIGKSRRFQLIVVTTMSEDCLDLLLRAHKLKYSKSRKAFIERNALGLVSKKYTVTDERRRQIVYFLRMVKKLAVDGIEVLWSSGKPDERFYEARRVFLNQPSTLTKPQNVFPQETKCGVELEPNETQDVADEDLLEDDSLDALPPREGFDAVEYSHNVGLGIYVPGEPSERDDFENYSLLFESFTGYPAPLPPM